MDVGRTLSRAREITWRWKFLWILGFFAALGQGASWSNSGYSFSSQDFQNGNVPGFNLSPAAGGLIVGLACLAVIVAIALWVISVIARGGLIAGVAQIEEEGSTTLGRAWAVGQSRFWTLFGIGILVALPILAVVVIMLLGIFLFAGGAALTAARNNQGGLGALISGLLACLCPSICLIVILSIVLAQIRIYAERAAILEGLGWTAAFGRGWQVLRDHLGPTVVLWIVFLVLGLVIGGIAFAIALPIVLPVAGMLSRTGVSSAPNWLLLAPICGLGLIGIVVAALISSVLNAFTSSTWTVAYREMTGPQAPVVPPNEAVVEG